MDIFKQKRYMILVIAILVILNLATLAMLWLGRSQRLDPLQRPGGPKQEQAQIRHLLKDELSFDKKQVEQYLALRERHRKKITILNDEIRNLKRQMFDEVLQNTLVPTLSDSLLALAQSKQEQIERLTFQHLLDLKKLCKAEQQEKLQLLMHELFRKPPPPDDPRPPRAAGENLPRPPDSHQ